MHFFVGMGQMKKIYEKPTLDKREKLAEIAAASSGPVNIQ